MITDGSYNKLLDLNWIRADIDGDGTFELIFTGNQVGVNPPEQVYDLTLSEKNNTGYKYYINNQYYANWDDIPKVYKVEQAKPDMPKVEVAKDWKIRF